MHEPDDDEPHPALVEYSPYRSDDLALAWFGRVWDGLAARGFAVVRIDVRGTGSSDGTATDEYTAEETEDGAKAVEWVAGQSWCTGRVGMFGISYSGFTSLQVASLQPRGLDAILAVSATDDRYEDDVHYGGGALRIQENAIWYGPWMVAMNALPPTPGLRADWREIWETRIQQAEPWLFHWLAHPDDGAYWRRGSVRGIEHRIACPTYLVSGWQDGYRNAALRLYAGLSVPKRCLIGPWAHFWPDWGVPGPAVDFMAEACNWFGRWLGQDDAAEHGDRITIFLQEGLRPLADTVGSWYSAADVEAVEHRLTARSQRLVAGEASEGHATFPIRPSAGAYAIPWGGMPWMRWPDDAVLDTATGLAYTGEPLARELVVVGRPRIRATVTTAAPSLNLAARLVDVCPDGRRHVVTSGVAAVGGSSHAAAGAHEVELFLDATAWRFASGHRVRVVIDAADWPNVWPSPSLGAVTLTNVELGLPEEDLERWTETPLPEAEAPAESGCRLVESPYEWRVSRDAASGMWRVRTSFAMGADFGDETAFAWEVEADCSLDERRPEAATVSSVNRLRYSADGVAVETEARLDLASTTGELHADLTLDVLLDGRLEGTRRWCRAFPRRPA